MTASGWLLPMLLPLAQLSTRSLKKNIQRLELGDINGSGTAIGTALGASINRLRDKEQGPIVVLLTDGENNSGEISPIGAAEAAKSLGVKVYTIATGQKGESRPLPQRASPT